MAILTGLAAFFTSIGTWFAGLGVVGQFLVRIGVGLALNGIASAIARAKQGKVKKPGVVFQLQQGADTPRAFMLGRGATGGSLVYHNEWGSVGGTPNAYYTRVTAVSDLPVKGLVEVWIDGQRVTLDTANEDPEKGFPVLEYQTTKERQVTVTPGDRGTRAVYETVTDITNYCWVKFYDGTQTIADDFLVNTVASDERPWTANEVGVGVAYAILTCRFNQELFQGAPRVLYVLDGVELEDPSTGLTGTGDDLPALQAYQLLKGLTFQGKWFYGLQNVADARFDDADWIAQILKCRADVPGAEGMTQQELEDTFGVPSIPSQYRSGGEVGVDIELGNALEAILTGCNGRLVDTGWKYRLLVGPAETASATISDGDILSTEEQTFTPFFGLADTTNGITAIYPEPDEEWQNQAAPPLYVPEYEAEDGNRRLLDQAEMSMVPYREQVQRLMAAALAEARRARRHTIALGPKYWALEPGDVIAWNSDRNGYAAKLFRVDGIYDLPTADIVLDITEVDPADYSWTAATDYTPVTPGTITPQPRAEQAVAGLLVDPYTIPDESGGDRRPGIVIHWDRDVDRVTSLRYQIRVATSGIAIADAQAAFDSGGVVISEGLSANVAYEVRAIYVVPDGRPVIWSAWVPVTTRDIRVGPNDLSEDIQADIQAARDEAAEVQSNLDAAVTSLTVDYNAAEQAAANAATAQAAAEAARDTAATHAATADGARSLAQTAQAAAEAARDLASGSASAASASETAAASSSLSAEVARDAAVGVMADLGQTTFENGASSWTGEGTTTTTTKGSIPTSHVNTGDPDFATYFSRGDGVNAIVGPIRSFPIDPDRVYRLKVVAKVLSNGSGVDGNSLFGVSTFNADGSVANTNVQFTLPRHDAAEGVYEEEVLASMRSAVAGDGISLRVTSSAASMAWFHYRMNGSNLTDAVFAINVFEVEDVTQAYDAGLSASAAATSESQASAYKDDAQAAASASSAAQVAAEAARDNATGSASAAASSASAAAASETAAGQSASAADASATSAETSASNASTSATQASSSATSASGSASTAATQASAAASSATDAGDSASASASSAQAAATSASSAGTSASAANTDRLAAETARSGAETARDEAVVARSDAEGFSAAAATSATVAATTAGQVAADIGATGPSTFDAPVEAWNYNSNHLNSSPYAKTNIITSEIVTGDADFGTCYEFRSAANVTVGPSRLYSWSPESVLAVTVQLKTVSDGTGVSNNQLGVTLYEGETWDDAADNLQQDIGDIAVADGPQTRTVWFTERTDLSSIALSETGFAPVVASPALGANGALFHVRQNAGGAGTVLQRVKFMEVRDVTALADALLAAEAAGGSASAAATSASSAAASDTSAGQSAAAAQTARTGAETARSGAETAQTAASTSASNAAGSAAAASTSESLSATAAASAYSTARDLLPHDFLSDGAFWTESINALPDAAPEFAPAWATFVEDGSRCVELNGDGTNQIVSNRGVAAIETGRTYRLTLEAKQISGTISGNAIILQARRFNDDHSDIKTTGQSFAPSALNTWETFSFDWTCADSYVKLRALFYLNGNAATGDNFRFRIARVQDVTSEVAAAGSASAAASSASVAQASETAAGASATSASSSANTAQTAASGASSSQASAAQSASDAAGSASSAAASATVAAQAVTDIRLGQSDLQVILDGVAALAGEGSLVTASEGGTVLGQSGSVIVDTIAGTISTSGTTNGAQVEVPVEQALQFQGRRVRVDILAKAADTSGAAQFVAAYSTSDNGNSGAKTFAVSSSWAWHSFYYDVPVANSGGADWIGLWGDEAQTGLKTQFARVIVRVVSLSDDIPEIGLVEADVTLLQAAQVETDGFASAFAGLVATTTGGNISGIRGTSWTNPDGTGGSLLELLGDNVIVDGSLSVNLLNAASFSSAGLAIFGGAIQSDNFVSGSSGWKINQNGSMELQNLVVRDWVQVGAVSDGVTFTQSAQAAKDNNTVVTKQTLGAFELGQFWQIAVQFKSRIRRKYGVYFDNKGGTGWTLYYERTQVKLQMRTLTGTTWSAWATEVDFGINTSTGTAWATYEDVISKMGVYDSVQFRLLVNINTYSPGTVTTDPGDTYYNNIDDVTLVARALVR